MDANPLKLAQIKAILNLRPDSKHLRCQKRCAMEQVYGNDSIYSDPYYIIRTNQVFDIDAIL